MLVLTNSAFIKSKMLSQAEKLAGFLVETLSAICAVFVYLFCADRQRIKLKIRQKTKEETKLSLSVYAT